MMKQLDFDDPLAKLKAKWEPKLHYINETIGDADTLEQFLESWCGEDWHEMDDESLDFAMDEAYHRARGILANRHPENMELQPKLISRFIFAHDSGKAPEYYPHADEGLEQMEYARKYGQPVRGWWTVDWDEESDPLDEDKCNRVDEDKFGRALHIAVRPSELPPGAFVHNGKEYRAWMRGLKDQSPFLLKPSEDEEDDIEDEDEFFGAEDTDESDNAFNNIPLTPDMLYYGEGGKWVKGGSKQ